MNNLKLLDCTLRDGGYYTNWDFDENLINSYFNSLNELPIDYIEIGYRSPVMNKYFGEFYFCSTLILEKIRKISNKKIVIILNEKDITINDINKLLNPCINIISLVRIAVDPLNIEKGIELAKNIKLMNFEVALNVMYVSKWKQIPNFFDKLSNIDEFVDYFYIVDSYGGIFPSELINIINLIKKKTKIKLGFHGHNNIELALINSLTAIENGIEIIDSTIFGMGRGAGNLKTELILTILNSKYGLDVNFDALSTVTDTFNTLQKKYEWGTNLPYMVSGMNSLPQKDVMDWVGKRYHSLNSIIRALNNKKLGLSDNEKYPIIKFEKQFDTVLIIGGGESAKKFHEYIVRFINIFSTNISIIHASSKNSLFYTQNSNNNIFCLVGNEGIRLEKAFLNTNEFSGICVLPPFPRKMGTYVPYKMKNNTFEFEKNILIDNELDSHTSLAIQTAISLGAKNCFLVGYDGYNGENISDKERDLISENESLFKYATNSGLNLISLTNTAYKNLIQDSIFSKI